MGDDDDFDDLVATTDGAMVVVTTACGGDTAGCLVGFHSQCSMEPQRYAVWLSKANHTYRVAVLADHLAVHFLADGDHDLAERFGTRSGNDVDKLADEQWRPGPGGVPLLDRCPRRIVLERTSLIDEGSDHACFVGRPVSTALGEPYVPLRLSDVVDLDPGHDPEERQR